MSLIHKIKQDNNTKNNTVVITNNPPTDNTNIVTNNNINISIEKDLKNINPRKKQVTMKLRLSNLNKIEKLSKKYNCNKQDIVDLAIDKLLTK